MHHDTRQPELAGVDAERHCARYGKKAALVKMTAEAPSPSLSYLNSRLSVFDCLPE